jgi:REP element-mobilizing transposase RayT
LDISSQVAQALACVRKALSAETMSIKNLQDTAPNGFQPVDPWNSETLSFKRRNLPHLVVPGATYFVTFRCYSNLVLSYHARDLVMTAIQVCDGKSIELDAAVVMPDHVHAIFRILGTCDLSYVLQRIKGRSAREINRALNREGPVWLDESFDHIVRHEAELQEKIEYIKQNPVKRGLVPRSEDYKWLFAKKATG